MFRYIEKIESFSDEKNMEKELYLNSAVLNIISDIKSSKYRQEALYIFMKSKEAKTPSKISKILGIEVSHTCKILNDLKNHELIICINEKDKKNKIHEISELGRSIGNIIIK
jgi:hypothetical protein